MSFRAARSWWPQENERVRLCESGSDGGLNRGRGSVEGKISGNEEEPVLSIALDSILPLRIVSRHSIYLMSSGFRAIRGELSHARLLTSLRGW